MLRWLTLATFVVILNETLMVNAIPRLMAQFDVTAAAAQWLSTAFMLTMAVVIPVTGWFLQRVTTRRAFAVAIGVFCAGTLAGRPRAGVLGAGPGPRRPGLRHGRHAAAADDDADDGRARATTAAGSWAT